MSKSTKNVRSLKIGCLVSDRVSNNRTLKTSVSPKIILSGKWLEDAGFCIGELVTLKIEEGTILISTVEGGANV